MPEPDLITDLRSLLAEGKCLCSSAHTDWRGIEELLDRFEGKEQANERAKPCNHEFLLRVVCRRCGLHRVDYDGGME